jgi:PucR family transcriptional regulator, purine catabolism regulatory protein
VDLQELVAQEKLGLVVVVGDAQGVDVSWVHSTDMAEPGAYLSGGELILTAGLWRHRPGDAERFVRSVTTAGAAAIGYGVEAPGADVPADVLQACRAVGVPLLRLPHELPFMQVSRAFHDAAGNAETRDVRWSLETHEALSEAVAGGGMTELVRAVSSRLRADVWVLDGPEVVWSQRQAPTQERVTATWRRGRPAAAFPVQAGLADGTAITVLRVDDEAPPRCFLGYGEAVATLTAGERRVLEDAVPYLRGGLGRLRERRAHAAERQRERLTAIEGGRPAGAGGKPLVSATQDALRAVAVLRYSSVPQPVADSLLDAVPAALGLEPGRQVAVVPDVAETVVVVDLPSLATRTDGEGTALVLERVLLAVDRQADRSAQLGWTFLCHADGLVHALSAARRAARLASARGAGGRIAQYESMGTHEVLLGLDDEVMLAYEDLVVGPLLDHDDRHGTHLVQTLREFLERSCGYQSSAQALGIHVNTLRYRLATIERVTGRDLHGMADRVDLFLALRSWADRRSRAR